MVILSDGKKCVRLSYPDPSFAWTDQVQFMAAVIEQTFPHRAAEGLTQRGCIVSIW
jgi:hypothetical protein